MEWQSAIDDATPTPRQRPTAHKPTAVRGRIPTPITSLVGRTAETEQLLGHLRNPAIRLIVLTGPGGVGKTRLALRVASLASADGASDVWYVELAPVSNPRLVVPTIAHAVGIWDGAQTSVVDRLVSFIGDRPSLLVLDNFEQVVDAAADIAGLLAACPGLTILVTSRTVLHLSGEHTILLSPLPLEGNGDATADAVALFAERAHEARASFELSAENLEDVVTICERLDGLPLAIELAAARIAHLSPRSLLPRLEGRLTSLTGLARDVPARLRTMRDAIDWSYHLLPEAEQRLFRRLSVLVGGFSIEAARAVGLDADTRDDAWLAIDAVASLVDQSLLIQTDGPEGEPRFSMLETIREYGLEHLADGGEAEATRSRHAEWCLQFAEEIRAGYAYRHDAGWRDRLEAELGNLRAALQWLSDEGHTELLLRLATALYPMWYYLGRGREGAGWLQAGLDRAAGVPAPVVLQATFHAAELIGEQCDHATANALAERAIDLARATGDKEALAHSLFLIGKNSQLSGVVAAGRARIEEALALFEEVGDEAEVAHTHTYLAMLGAGGGAHELDDQDQLSLARRCWETELEIFTASGNVTMTTRAIHGLAYVAYLSGNHERALNLSHEAMRTRWAMGDIRVLPAEFEDIADICNAVGQHERAARLYGAASALRERLDTPIPWWFEAEYEREVDRSREGLSARQFDAAWNAGRGLSIEQALELALDVRVASAQTEASSERRPYELTERELQVLRHLVEGASNGEIAAALYISPKTAANHVANILAKLGAESRTAAASIALRHGIV